MRHIIRHAPIALLTTVALLLGCQASWARQPNVLIILTDDQGWGDLSIHGNPNLATPQIDSLARQGASFESFYVCQVCAPTRAELLTGRYYPRTGVSGVSTGQERLNPDELTLADVFRADGYRTGAFGKWHNGTQSPYHPNDRGFEEFYGFTSGHWGHYFSPPLDHNGQTVRGNGFVADDFTDHAIEFMQRHRNDRFLCYVPFNTPHSPMMVPDRFYEKFDGADLLKRHRDPEREDVMMTRAALALCENIDWNVGRLLATLEKLALERDTIVVFLSDNGPNSYRFNGDMKGRKGSIDEGGVRSPCFVRWPGRIPAGLRIEQIAAAIDLLPTLTELAEVEFTERKPLDGISLADGLLGRTRRVVQRTLFSTKRDQVSVRTQRFRLDSTGRLFELAKDPGQRTNVAGRYPETAARLSQLAQSHAAQMQRAFQANRDRPFTVGYRPSTTLPARDGIAHGTIERSSKAPNNSFFTHWTRADDSISWDIQVGADGDYAATVYYTCAVDDVGATVTLEAESADGSHASRAKARVTKAFDPPLYDKSKERVAQSHYFVKDFQPLRLGKLALKRGRATLRLGALDIIGQRVIDVHSVQLQLEQPSRER